MSCSPKLSNLQKYTRKSLFEAMNVLTTMFTFRSFDKMIKFILLSRQSDTGLKLEEFMLIE